MTATTQHGLSRHGRSSRQCIECGESVSSSRVDAEFCCSACRQAFANRRAARGAELYDLFMLHRFERATAQELKALGLMNRRASVWRSEDKAARAGRRSWMHATKTAQRLAPYRATTISRRT